MIDHEKIKEIISGFKFSFLDEKEFQSEIQSVLTLSGVSFSREHRLDDRSIIDFLVDGGIGVEIKIDGSRHAIMRQLFRYLSHEKVKSLILLTPRRSFANMPNESNGKKISVILAGNFV